MKKIIAALSFLLLANASNALAQNNPDNIIVYERYGSAPRKVQEYTLSGTLVKEQLIPNPPNLTPGQFASVCGTGYSFAISDYTATTSPKLKSVTFQKSAGRTGVAWSHVVAPTALANSNFMPGSIYALACSSQVAYYLDPMTDKVYRAQLMGNTFTEVFSTGYQYSHVVDVALSGNITVLNQIYTNGTLAPTGMVISEHAPSGTHLDAFNVPFFNLPEKNLINAGTSFRLASGRDSFYLAYDVFHTNQSGSQLSKYTSYILKINPLSQIVGTITLPGKMFGDLQIRDDGVLVFSALSDQGKLIGKSNKNLAAPTYFQVSTQTSGMVPRVDFVNSWHNPNFYDGLF